jgi:hypothetical protein
MASIVSTEDRSQTGQRRETTWQASDAGSVGAEAPRATTPPGVVWTKATATRMTR